MIVALLILAGFAVLFVLMLVDVDRLCDLVAHEELVDELWDEEAAA